MRPERTPIKIPLLAVLLLLTIAPQPAHAQSEITLRRVAAAPETAPIRLADVAVLEGEQATALAEFVIEPHPEQRLGPSNTPFEITIIEIRRLLSEADDVHWGRLILRGSRCVVHSTRALHDDERDSPPPVETLPELAERITQGTIKAQLVSTIASFLSRPRADLRLRFETADRAFLAQAIAERKIEARPMGLSDPLAIRVTLFEAGRIAESRIIRAGVEIRQPVAIVRTDKRRGDPITESDVARETRWLDPVTTALTPDQAIGQAATTRLRVGDVLTSRDVETPIVAKRGERVTVHCVNGPVTLKTTARATRDARDGEIVELETLDGRGVIVARMSGKRRAVATSAQHPPARKEESP